MQTERLSVAQTIELAKAVASELTKIENVNGKAGTAWRFKPLNESYPTQYIVKVGQEECEVSLHPDWPKAGTVHIGGNFHLGRKKEFVDVREWNHSIGGRSALPTINVSLSRGADVIAREISRRFLPEYLDLFNKAIAKRESQNTWQDKTRANLLELAAIVKADTSRLKDNDEAVSISFYDNEKGYGDIQASDNSCNLKLSSLSLDKAKRILAIMAE